MKIITYNVNGLRSAMTKGLNEWIKATDADVLCFQEVKSNPEQVDTSYLESLGYKGYWACAEKKGYSGVAIFTRIKPLHVEYGCGMEAYDYEGRVIRADFEHFSVLNVYMPSGSSSEERQAFKFQWMDDFLPYANRLKKKLKGLVICGDYNICHQAIDIHNPKSNAKSSGFLPEEREWMSTFFKQGFIDAFRHQNPEPHHYTWWSYRANARAKNLGWRIDYHSITENLLDRLVRTVILPEAKHSDHCPVLLEIKG
jgi:exodeoxyribonuclease III